MKKMKKIGTVALAGSIILSMGSTVLAAPASTNSVVTGRTQQNIQSGVITPDSFTINRSTLTGTVLIDGPKLVMSVIGPNGQIDKQALIKTFPISDTLFGYSITVASEGSYTLNAKTVYINGKTAGQTHTEAKPVTVSLDLTPPVITIGSYNTNPTNQSITVTASTNEGALNAGSHTFDANGSFEFVATDAAGNTSKNMVTINNIDKNAPTASVSYSTTSLVNTDVTATITPSESITVTNTVDGSLSYTFKENGSFTFEFVDAAGNPGSVTATVNNIDKTSPVGSIDYSTKEPTNGNVTTTLNATKPITVTNNDGSLSYTFTDNGSFTFEFVDAAGNTGTAIATIDNIDKLAPTATFDYSTLAPTNGNVTVTITPSESITVTNNNGSLNHTFTDNGSFTFEFVDAAGNVGSAVATVNNIDMIAPTATVGYSTLATTNDDVTATITPSESITVTNNNGSLSHIFADNGSFTFEFVDAAGNTGIVITTVNNIDKIAPTATVDYSTAVVTNGDVTATITPSEEITVTNNNGSLSHAFTENGSFTFEFVDAAGNTGSVEATVNNIDTVVPTATVGYSTTSLVNTNVTASVTPSEPITVTNNNGSLSHEFTENGSFTYEFVDAAGNTGSVEATVNNIDKTSPIGSIEYSETIPTNHNVTATIKPSKPVTVTNTVYGSLSHTFTENGSFTFEFVDAAGNTGTAVASVNNIDKETPTATVDYSTFAPTNGEVTVTITPSESITVTNNNGSLSHTFADNGSFTFEYVDAAGNTGSTIATVNNIDKIVPTATVGYSTLAATNGDVIATITPSESVTVTNNNGSLSHTFTDNGSFTFVFVDAAGNTGSAVATVNNIDKTAPVVTGVTNNQVTNQAVTPTFTEGTATLNGQPFTSGTAVSAAGSYTLIVTDSAGNATTVTFKIVAVTGYNVTVTSKETIANNSGNNNFKVTYNVTFNLSDGETSTFTGLKETVPTNAGSGSGGSKPVTTTFNIGGLSYTVTYTITV